MARYVFFPASTSDAKPLVPAKKIAHKHGATVVRSIAGSLLLEVDAAKVAQLARALPGWSYSIERKTTRLLPERRPLERARMAASKG